MCRHVNSLIRWFLLYFKAKNRAAQNLQFIERYNNHTGMCILQTKTINIIMFYEVIHINRKYSKIGLNS